MEEDSELEEDLEEGEEELDKDHLTHIDVIYRTVSNYLDTSFNRGGNSYVELSCHLFSSIYDASLSMSINGILIRLNKQMKMKIN